jgi:hypothetical protein
MHFKIVQFIYIFCHASTNVQKLLSVQFHPIFFGSSMFNQNFSNVMVFLLGILLISPLAVAQSIPQNGNGAADCTEVDIKFVDDPTLTREENIHLMDQALIRSLSKFDACMTSQDSTSSAGGSSGSAGFGGSTGGGGSIAASDMSGTEKQASPTSAVNVETGSESMTSTGTGQSAGKSGTNLDETIQDSENGRIPEDIPSADNDSVLEAQIRQAAMNETDPEIKEKLWDEYRKYKGKSQDN